MYFFPLTYLLFRLACGGPGGHVRKVGASGLLSIRLRVTKSPLTDIPQPSVTPWVVNSLKLSKAQVGSQDRGLGFKAENNLTMLAG